MTTPAASGTRIKSAKLGATGANAASAPMVVTAPKEAASIRPAQAKKRFISISVLPSLSWPTAVSSQNPVV